MDISPIPKCFWHMLGAAILIGSSCLSFGFVWGACSGKDLEFQFMNVKIALNNSAYQLNNIADQLKYLADSKINYQADAAKSEYASPYMGTPMSSNQTVSENAESNSPSILDIQTRIDKVKQEINSITISK